MSRLKNDNKSSKSQLSSTSVVISSVLSHHSTIGSLPAPISIQDSTRRAVPEQISTFNLPSTSNRPRALARNHSIFRENQVKFQDQSFLDSSINPSNGLLHRDWERERKVKEIVEVEWKNRGYDQLELKEEVERRIRQEDGEEDLGEELNQDSVGADQQVVVSKKKGPLTIENR